MIYLHIREHKSRVHGALARDGDVAHGCIGRCDLFCMSCDQTCMSRDRLSRSRVESAILRPLSQVQQKSARVNKANCIERFCFEEFQQHLWISIHAKNHHAIDYDLTITLKSCSKESAAA